jgi:hypothetical protein
MRKSSSILCVLSLLASAGAASATSINVAIVSALATQSFNDDVVAKIQTNAPFLNITVIPVLSSTPSIAVLDLYQAVMVIGSQPFADSAALGNVLKDYIDQGHGVVVTALSNTNSGCGSTSTYQLCGLFDSIDYWAILPGAINQNNAAALGSVWLPNDPVMAGVLPGAAGLNGGSISYRINGIVHPSANLVASWTDGTPLVVTRNFASGAKEVALNFMPVSEDGWTGLWKTNSQGGLLLANALSAAADGAEVPEPSTYFVTGTGLALVGLLLRRRVRTIQCGSEHGSRQH